MSDIESGIILPAFRSDELDREDLEGMIVRKESFEITHVSEMGNVVELVEHLIESHGMRCRIYTANRLAVLGTAAAASVATGVGVALATGVAMAAAVHNIATFNPHYEISKHVVDEKVRVRFMK